MEAKNQKQTAYNKARQKDGTRACLLQHKAHWSRTPQKGQTCACQLRQVASTVEVNLAKTLPFCKMPKKSPECWPSPTPIPKSYSCSWNSAICFQLFSDLSSSGVYQRVTASTVKPLSVSSVL